MNLPFFIAGRYLFARKSHNVINIISAISAIGMAIGTAALITILSVYNGFDSLIKSSLNSFDPDIKISPATGKVFVPEGELFDFLDTCPQVISIDKTLQENVFLGYDDNQGLAVAKGVEDLSLHEGDIELCAIGSTLAYNMNINPNFVTPLRLYYPDRNSNISLANPMASLKSVSVHPSRLLSISADLDNSLVMVPIETMRRLLGYENEVSAIEVRLEEGYQQGELNALMKKLENLSEGKYRIKDRVQQNESLFKMMHYEKTAIFFILLFVIIIIAFNIFGSLTMLIIDKKEDIATMLSMGMTKEQIQRTFTLEGWMISILGLVAGLVLGIVFALIQQKFGIIAMPGNFIVSSYPIIIKGSDLLITSLGVAAIGYIIALIPARSRSKDSWE